MSYILDALRKSDQQRQRQRGTVPTLETLPIMVAPTRRPVPWPSLALGGALLLAGIALGWWRPWEQAVPTVEQTEPSAPAPVSSAPLPEAAPLAVAPLPTASLPAASLSADTSSPAAAPTTPPTAPIQEPRPAPRPQASSPPVAISEAPDLESLPASFRQGLPPLVISFLIDAPAPLDRRAMIDNTMLRPGESFGPDIFLESIRGNGVTLVYQGQRFRKVVHP